MNLIKRFYGACVITNVINSAIALYAVHYHLNECISYRSRIKQSNQSSKRHVELMVIYLDSLGFKLPLLIESLRIMNNTASSYNIKQQ